MSWPWVSRERLTDAVSIRDSRIAKLEKQLDDLDSERKRLMDFIAVRSNNMPIYGLITPPAVEQDEPESEKQVEDERSELPPSRTRQFVRKVENVNRERFQRDESEADRLISEMQEQGRQAAEKLAGKTPTQPETSF